ncbi:ribonuclease H-like domain-containing protein [Tanacetum coccineum]
MVNCNPSRTPVDTKSKLGDDGDPVSDPTLYSESCGFSIVSYFYSPKYFLCSATDHALQLFSSSTTSLVAYSDADWAGCPTTRRSNSSYCVRVLHFPSRYHYVDIFTKVLPSSLFEGFHKSVRCPPAQTAGEY